MGGTLNGNGQLSNVGSGVNKVPSIPKDIQVDKVKSFLGVTPQNNLPTNLPKGITAKPDTIPSDKEIENEAVRRFDTPLQSYNQSQQLPSINNNDDFIGNKVNDLESKKQDLLKLTQDNPKDFGAQTELAVLNKQQQLIKNYGFSDGTDAGNYIKNQIDKKLNTDIGNLDAHPLDWIKGVLPQNLTTQLALQKYQQKRTIDDAANKYQNFDDFATNLYGGKNANETGDAKAGTLIDEGLNNPDIIQKAKTNPQFGQQYQIAKDNLYVNHPTYANKKLGTDLGQIMEDNNMNSWLYSNPGVDKTDKAADLLVKNGTWTYREMNYYKQNIRPVVEAGHADRIIPLTDFAHQIGYSLNRGAEQYNKSMRNILNVATGNFLDPNGNSLPQNLGLIENEQDKKAREDQQLYATSSVEPQGLKGAFEKPLTTVASVAPMLLGGLAGVPEEANMVLMFESGNQDRAAQLYPGDDAKSKALRTEYSILGTTLDASLMKLLPVNKMLEAKKTLEPEIQKTISSLASGDIEQAEVKPMILDKVNKYIGSLPKEAVKTANVLTAYNYLHKGLDAASGSRNLQSEQDSKGLIDNYLTNLLSGAGLAAMSSFGEAIKQPDITLDGKAYQQMADSYDYIKQILNEQLQKNPQDPTIQEKLSNLDHIKQVNDELNKNTKLSNEQKQRFLALSLKGKVTEDANKNIPDKTLANKDAVKDIEQQKQDILNNPQPEQPTEQPSTTTVSVEKAVGNEGFINAGSKSKKSQDPSHLGKWIVDNAKVGDEIKFPSGNGYEIVNVSTSNRTGRKTVEIHPFEINDDGSKMYGTPLILSSDVSPEYRNQRENIEGVGISPANYDSAGGMFEQSFRNNKGEQINEQAKYIPKTSEKSKSTTVSGEEKTQQQGTGLGGGGKTPTFDKDYETNKMIRQSLDKPFLDELTTDQANDLINSLKESLFLRGKEYTPIEDSKLEEMDKVGAIADQLMDSFSKQGVDLDINDAYPMAEKMYEKYQRQKKREGDLRLLKDIEEEPDEEKTKTILNKDVDLKGEKKSSAMNLFGKQVEIASPSIDLLKDANKSIIEHNETSLQLAQKQINKVKDVLAKTGTEEQKKEIMDLFDSISNYMANTGEDMTKNVYDEFSKYVEDYDVDNALDKLSELQKEVGKRTEAIKKAKESGFTIDDLKQDIKNTINKNAESGGQYEKWIKEGRVSGHDVKKIIESAGLEVPDGIKKLAENEKSIPTPKQESTVSAKGTSVLDRPIHEVSIDDILNEINGNVKGEDISNKVLSSGNQSDIDNYVSKAKSVLQSLYPKATLETYDTDKEFEKAGGTRGSRGTANMEANGEHRILLNLSEIKRTNSAKTAIHEVIHPIVADAIGTSWKDASSAWGKISSQMNGVKGMDAVLAHAEQYPYTQQAPEGITELLTHIAQGKIDINDIPKEKQNPFIQFINTILEKLGIDYKIKTPESFSEFAQKIKESFDKGTGEPLKESIKKGKLDKYLQEIGQYKGRDVDPERLKQLHELLDKKIQMEKDAGNLKQEDIDKIYKQLGRKPIEEKKQESTVSEKPQPEETVQQKEDRLINQPIEKETSDAKIPFTFDKEGNLVDREVPKRADGMIKQGRERYAALKDLLDCLTGVNQV